MKKFPHSRDWLRFALSLASVGLSPVVRADEPPPATPDAPRAGVFSSESTHLFGDWGGARSDAEAAGWSFLANYTSEFATNTTGGDRRATAYADQWVAMMNVDTAKAGGWEGGHFRVTFTNRNGTELGARSGLDTLQQTQEVFGRGPYLRLTQFWYEQTLLEDRLACKFGLLTVGEDFFNVPCDFQNLTFIASDPGNLVGDYIYNWPVSQWGARVRVALTRELALSTAVYQANPTYLDPAWTSDRGWRPDWPGGTTGAIMPVELTWTPTFGGLPGRYFIGGWYGTNDGDDVALDRNGDVRLLTGLPARRHPDRYGFYFGGSQQYSGKAGGEGARVFVRFIQSDQATSRTDRQFAVGTIYTGPFGRRHDLAGFAVGATHMNNRVKDATRRYNAVTGADLPLRDYEYVAEIFYGYAPAPWVRIQPNLQYIRHPGGTGRNNDAIVLGVKTTVDF